MTKWADVVGDVGRNQYEQRIDKLKRNNIDTTSIEATVKKTIDSLSHGHGRSFVIFGEPQSGKTEMMIALNAKLLDDGRKIIVNLLTDSVDLLQQSLKRFRNSGLSPSPKQYSELPPDAKDLRGKEWVIFSKKNARDLEKLIELLRNESGITVIDDEADYASPNAKVNRDEKTKINQLIGDLIGEDGQYIGVTATPARLNLNNTFNNESELWVDFLPHPHYVGQSYFFPEDGKVDYQLHTFHHDEGSEKIELETAILHFLCGVARLHEQGVRENFTMLVHTSGNRADHAEDVEVIRGTISAMSNPTSGKFNQLITRLEDIADHYAQGDRDSIVEFVLRNINRHIIVEINSGKSSGEVADIATPTSLFSFGAGGNIISRGVTFDNLLSMYFTRAVKGKFSQDTYIQRARMFGTREKYKQHFQLWIPDTLLANWDKCFRFHKLAVDAMRSGAAPVWLSDHKTTPTASSSIDKSSVDFEGGEMSFALFDFDEQKYGRLMGREGRSDEEMLRRLDHAFSDMEFPSYLHRYLVQDVVGNRARISFHKASPFGVRTSKYTQEERDTIRRKKGIFANNEFGRSELPFAKHHLKIFYNDAGQARLFYKINGGAIRFVQNRK